MPTLEWIGKDKVVSHHLEVLPESLQQTYGFMTIRVIQMKRNKLKGIFSGVAPIKEL